MSKRVSIHKVASEGKATAVAKILKRDAMSPDVLDEQRNTPLVLACLGGHSNVADVLVKAGANVNCRCGPGKATVLCAAFRKGHIGLVRDLMKAGADFSVLDAQGQAVIHECVVTGSVNDVRQLVQLGADLNVRDREGFTPLMRCSELDNTGAATASVLLDGRADWSLKLSSGDTALTIACSVGNAKAVKVLLAAGVSTSTQVNGDCPVRRAASAGHKEIVKLLCDAGAEIDVASTTAPLITAASAGKVDVVRLLCEAGADPNMADSHSNVSALRYAAQAGHAAVVRELLRYGADVNEGQDDVTALHLVCNLEHLDVIRELVRAGANHVLDANYVMTALHLAADKLKLKVARVLLEEGGLETAVDRRGWTPARVVALNAIQNPEKDIPEAGAMIRLL
ncbi:unnamed protein product, partial [Sphacelaria rigidula]